MTTTIPLHVTCGCCSRGCVCSQHQDVPRGLQVKVCDYHTSLAAAPLDPQYRWDPHIDEFVRVPIVTKKEK